MTTRAFALAAVLALASAACAPPPGPWPAGGIGPEFVGSWRGVGSQSDQPGEWTIALTLADGPVGGVVGTIAYPSLACGGDLVLREAAPGQLVLLEDITFGTCVDLGTITLTPADGGGLRYDFVDPTPPATATGTLARARR